MLVPFDEKLKDIALKIKDIAYKIGFIADYVVERGGNSTCYYEKWNSGHAVLYGLLATANMPVASGTNQIYGTVNFPFTLKTITSAITASTSAYSVGGYGEVGTSIRDLSLTNATYCHVQVSLASGLTMLYASYEIKGTWK